MIDSWFVNLVALPAGLGLVGFVEPCSIGATLLFVKYLEGEPDSRKLAEVLTFALTRAVFIGGLGAVAALIGAMFIGFQRTAWVLLGLLYGLIGVLYLAKRAGALMVSLGPGLGRLSATRGSAGLGVLFGLNIPACAAPLLIALLGTAAASGATAGTLVEGFVSLGVFGLALSLPLVVAALSPRANGWIDRLAALSRQFPRWTGLVMLVIGLWSIGFGLFVRVAPA